ncbi:MAG: hypothetical protein WCB53_12030, partial [Terriglobales bacterium]
LAGLSLPSYIQQEVQASEIKLASIQPPAGLDATVDAAIKASVREAFVYGFRVILSICAGLSLASAAVAWLMIPPKRDGPG